MKEKIVLHIKKESLLKQNERKKSMVKTESSCNLLHKKSNEKKEKISLAFCFFFFLNK
jgi:hypothetical protein